MDGDSEYRILLLDKPLEGNFYPLQVIPQSNVLFHSGHISGRRDSPISHIEVFEYFVGPEAANDIVTSLKKDIFISNESMKSVAFIPLFQQQLCDERH